MTFTSAPPVSARTVDISRELAYTSYLRVAAMVGVVIIHVAGLTYVAAPQQFDAAAVPADPSRPARAASSGAPRRILMW